MVNVIKRIFHLYRNMLIVFSMPIVFAGYFCRHTGREYGVGFFQKFILLLKMIRNNIMMTMASNFLEHLAMATKILNTPKNLEGCVVECGTYKGGSTANLSLVCSLCNRSLEVFDSFEGLPKPIGEDAEHIIIDKSEIHSYSKGAWQGSLDEVKKNILSYGDLNVCRFNVGYFSDTLPYFKKKCVFVFLDVDLCESLETCLGFLWPLLQSESFLFTHEAQHLEISSLFFDKQWWHENMNCKPPGFVGAGNGLGLVASEGGFKSGIGFTVKNPDCSGFFNVLPKTG